MLGVNMSVALTFRAPAVKSDKEICGVGEAKDAAVIWTPGGRSAG